LHLYNKEKNLLHESIAHKETAHKLWSLREIYTSLIIDIKIGALKSEEIRTKRDELLKKLVAIYKSAPQTSPQGYSQARKSLKHEEENTLWNQEIDSFLPEDLKKDE
jgi:hypothetical protein